MASRRGFVYLVMNDTTRRDFSLRRIDAASLFFPNGERPPVRPPPQKDTRLPPPVFRFSAPATPTSGTGTGTSKRAMDFMLLHGSGGGWRKRPKVVATDHACRCVLYDPVRGGTVRALPELPTTAPLRPVALPVGDDDLYVIDTHFHRDDACFHGLLFDAAAADWGWRPMPPPPYARTYDPDSQRVRAHITSYAVVGSSGGGGDTVWVSKDGLGTHCFDVGAGEWAKAGDWVLPFAGPGTYVPEHKLWFGLLADKVEDGVVCAADLTLTEPAAPRVLWREPPTPPERTGRSAFLVHLGCSSFCLARFFNIVRRGKGGSPRVSRFAVFSGLEVVTGSHGDGEGEGEGEELRMVKHRSVRFSLGNKLLLHWVL